MKNIIEFNIEYIIEEYSNYVFKIVHNVVGTSLSYQDKEEIVSDTFYLLWRNQDKINANLKSYLGTIARHVSYGKLRKEKVNFEYIENIDTVVSFYEDDLLEIKDRISSLDEEEKKLFVLFYVDGLKIKEIAKLCGKKVNNIKIRLYRLRKKLKEKWYNERNWYSTYKKID